MTPIEEHVELIQQLAAVHSPFGWSDQSVDGYLLGLGDLPLDALRQAVVSSIQTGGKMPTPAEIRRDVLAMVVTDGPPSPEAAWREVEAAASTVGRDGTPNWSHPLIGEAVGRACNWWKMCTREDGLSNESWAFRNEYRSLFEAAMQDALRSRGLSATAALQPVHPYDLQCIEQERVAIEAGIDPYSEDVE
jgi:hypothetical protein